MAIKDHQFKSLEKKKQVASVLIRAITFILSTLGLLTMVLMYSVIGGFVFQWLEGENELQIKKAGRETIHATMQQKALNIYRDLDTAAKSGLTSHDRQITLNLLERELSDFFLTVWEFSKNGRWDGSYLDSGEVNLGWTFTGALLFSVTTITAIGYGTIAPRTQTGRITCIFYSIFGLPITMLCIANIGLWFAQQVRLMHKKISARCRKSTTSHVQEVPVLFSLITMVAYVFLGTAIFCTWEDWTAVEGAYFSFITLTTIGFGDIVPDVYRGGSAWDRDSNKTFELIICGFYLFFGLALLAMCMDLMKEEVRANFLWLGQKMGLGASKRKPKEQNKERE